MSERKLQSKASAKKVTHTTQGKKRKLGTNPIFYLPTTVLMRCVEMKSLLDEISKGRAEVQSLVAKKAKLEQRTQVQLQRMETQKTEVCFEIFKILQISLF